MLEVELFGQNSLALREIPSLITKNNGNLLHRNIQDIFQDLLDDMEQLPSWLQAKITKASDYMSMVYHYLDYEFARRDGSLMEEVDKYKEEMLKELTEEPNEGNAYIDAMRKAKEAGEDEFEVDGETHKVK